MWCTSLYIETILEYVVVVREGELDRNVIRKRAEEKYGKACAQRGYGLGASLVFVCEPGDGPLCRETWGQEV